MILMRVDYNLRDNSLIEGSVKTPRSHDISHRRSGVFFSLSIYRAYLVCIILFFEIIEAGRGLVKGAFAPVAN